GPVDALKSKADKPAKTTAQKPSAVKSAASVSTSASTNENKAEKPVIATAPKPRENSAPTPPPPPQHQITAAAEATVRVDTQRLDDIMNMVGELVLVRNRLVRLGLESTDEAMQKAVANLD